MAMKENEEEAIPTFNFKEGVQKHVRYRFSISRIGNKVSAPFVPNSIDIKGQRAKSQWLFSQLLMSVTWKLFAPPP